MEKQRFAALDGLRGVCAVIVLLFHGFRLTRPDLFAHGYLSVDVFFILSGFVLAFAFRDALDGGMGVLDFMKARVRRLGPVLWFGAGFSVLTSFAIGMAGGVTAPSYAVLLAGAQAALLVPLTGASHTDAFPLNGPTWSLFAEFWINAGFALMAPRLKPSTLVAIIAGGWTFLIVRALSTGQADFGATEATILFSVPRALPSFACGVLLFKLWRAGALTGVPSVHPLLVFAGWTAVAMMPASGPVFDLVQIVVVAPLMIALLACSRHVTPGWLLWLGRISYPLYATHAVIIHAGESLMRGPLPVWAIMMLVALSMLLADMLARWYEPAMRRIGDERRALSLNREAVGPSLAP